MRKIFWGILTNTYTIFASAVFYDHKNIKDFTYEINSIYRYQCQDGKWSIERFISYKGRNKCISELLKAVDFLMRKHYNFKSTLKADKITKIYHDIITSAIENYQLNKKKEAKAQVVIDISKLQGIRKAADIIQNKLIAQDESEEIMPEKITRDESEEIIPDRITQDERGERIPEVMFQDEPKLLNLTAVECEFIRCLLYGDAYKDLLKRNGIMESVIVDTINEKLFEMFNDTIIDFNGQGFEIINDYIGKLKEMLNLA